nr:hypothetical protein [Tanacetum cinerariifolium]
MGGGDDGGDDNGDSSGDDVADEDMEEEEEDEEEEGEEEHIASADSTAVIPVVELVSSPEGTKPVLPVPQDEDEREPRFIQAHDPDFVPEPVYPEYIPLEDEHVLSVEEQPLPPVDSPTTESPGYFAESDPEEDPEYEDDEEQDGPVDYPMG